MGPLNARHSLPWWSFSCRGRCRPAVPHSGCLSAWWARSPWSPPPAGSSPADWDGHGRQTVRSVGTQGHPVVGVWEYEICVAVYRNIGQRMGGRTTIYVEWSNHFRRIRETHMSPKVQIFIWSVQLAFLLVDPALLHFHWVDFPSRNSSTID